MKRAILVLLHCVTLAALSVALTACESLFEHNLQGEPIPLDPFLGTWSLVELLGTTPESPTLVRIESDAIGELVVTVSDAAGTTEVNATLTSLGEATILSTMNKNGTWQISNVSLADDGNRLLIQLPDFGLLRDDVAAGVIAGEVRQVDLDQDDLVVVTASTSRLSAYLGTKSDLFQEVAAVLEKNTGG